MRRFTLGVTAGLTAIAIAANVAGAQLARTRSPGGPETAAPQAGVARDARFPYAGSWSGTRRMPVGSDEIAFNFTVADGKYSGVTVHPDGSAAPQHNLAATAAGLTWEQPNSGGGTWMFTVRLVGPDSMAGTLVLRDPPANLTPAPAGTMVLTRRASAARRPK